MTTSTRTALAGAALAIAAALAGCDEGSAPTRAATQAQAQVSPAAPAAKDGATAVAGGSPIAIANQWGIRGKGDIEPSGMLDPVYEYVLDGSGSMSDGACSSGHYKEGRIGDARDAAIAYERSLPPAAKIGLYVFDASGIGQRVAIGSGPASRAAFERAVAAVRAGNGTPLGPAIETGAAALEAVAEMQGGYGSYHLIVETDGMPDSMPALAQAVAAVERTPIILETIGFCIDSADHPLRQPGEMLYRDARNPADLMAGLKEMAAETDAFASAADDGSQR